MNHAAMDRPTARTILTLLGLLAMMPAITATADTTPDTSRTITSQPSTAEVSVALGQRLIRAMYQQCGLEAEFLEVPSARALSLAETGRVDGELARIPGVVNAESELVPLQPPLIHLQLVPMFLDPSIPRDHSLESAQRIGYINGYRMAPPILPDGKIIIPARNTDHLVLLLEKGRIDVALTLAWDAQQAARNFNQLIIGDPVLEAPLLHYINRSRAADAPCLSQALQELQAAGFVRELISSLPLQSPQTAADTH